MPRPHESFEGVMVGNVRNGAPEANQQVHAHKVEVRIITGNEPGNINIILPAVDKYVSQNAEGSAGYDWIGAHELEDVSVSGLIAALHKLGTLTQHDDGSFRIRVAPGN